MSVTGVSANLAPLIQSVLDINKQLDTLQQQLGTGQKSETYGGLGAQSGVAVALNAQLAALSSYDQTITNVGTTVSLQQQVLQQVAKTAATVQASAVQQSSFTIGGSGQTTVQSSAADALNQILSALNSQGGNGYLFSGSALNQPSVDTADHILNGNGAAAGLRQVVTERNQADLGADGLGRLVIPAAAGAAVSVSEDAAGSAFGLKLAAVSSTLTNAVVTGPSGSPAGIGIDLSGGNPNNGDTVTFTFSLPDGTAQTLQLQATTSATPGANQFSIGATPTATAANLQAALTAGVAQIGSTSLSAASAMAACQQFLRRSADACFRYAGDCYSADRRNKRQHRILVHGQQRPRLDSVKRHRAYRSDDERRLRHPGERTRHSLARAERRGVGGDQLFHKRPECGSEL